MSRVIKKAKVTGQETKVQRKEHSHDGEDEHEGRQRSLGQLRPKPVTDSKAEQATKETRIF